MLMGSLIALLTLLCPVVAVTLRSDSGSSATTTPAPSWKSLEAGLPDAVP